MSHEQLGPEETWLYRWTELGFVPTVDITELDTVECVVNSVSLFRNSVHEIREFDADTYEYEPFDSYLPKPHAESETDDYIEKMTTPISSQVVTLRNVNDFTFSVFEEYTRLFRSNPTYTYRFDFNDEIDPVLLKTWVDENIISKFPPCKIHKSSRLWYRRTDEGSRKQIEQTCSYYYSLDESFPFAVIHLATPEASESKFSLMTSCVRGEDLIAELVEKFKESNSLVTKKHRKADDKFGIVTKTQDGFNLQHFKIKHHSQDVLAQYNDDFLPIHDRILSTFNMLDKNGIVLLHGAPGTGKTTYLRYLIGVLQKEPIYLPPDMAHHIASPEFVSFLADQSNSVLIVEDAENVLRTRAAGGNQAVSNILNVSDGILGDALNLQIIATFNVEREEIDPALLRPGRLIAEYEFKALTVTKTTELMTKLYGSSVEYSAPEMTLAEIYNHDKEHMLVKKDVNSFGFL